MDIPFCLLTSPVFLTSLIFFDLGNQFQKKWVLFKMQLGKLLASMHLGCFPIEICSKQIQWGLQSQQQKQMKKLWNMFKINNKDTRTVSTTSFWCIFTVKLEHISYLFLLFTADFEQLDPCWNWTINVQLQWKLSKVDTYRTKTGSLL